MRPLKSFLRLATTARPTAPSRSVAPMTATVSGRKIASSGEPPGSLRSTLCDGSVDGFVLPTRLLPWTLIVYPLFTSDPNGSSTRITKDSSHEGHEVHTKVLRETFVSFV